MSVQLLFHVLVALWVIVGISSIASAFVGKVPVGVKAKRVAFGVIWLLYGPTLGGILLNPATSPLTAATQNMGSFVDVLGAAVYLGFYSLPLWVVPNLVEYVVGKLFLNR
ncbi:MAG: hypothetical protein ACYCYO_01685 [Bacilli bacterium]